MLSEFDICGVHIPFSDIKDYRVVHREYIYRPIYRESEVPYSGGRKLFSSVPANSKKYEFYEMVPFASVLVKGEKEYKLATESYNPFSLQESIIKDVAVEALSRVKSKAVRKKFHCKNIAGRYFTVYLDDVPASVMRQDGKISDIYKNDELYPLLGEPIAPSILTVPALNIITPKENFIFFGDGIQLQDAQAAYEGLRRIMIEREEQKEQLKLEAKNNSMLSNITKKIMSVGNKTKEEEQVKKQDT